jgi:hypothetical protein
LFGISVLAAMAFVVTVAALQAAFGLSGTAVAAAVLLIVGNPLNGVTVATPLLPNGCRQIPNDATVRAINDQIYFGGQHSPKALATPRPPRTCRISISGRDALFANVRANGTEPRAESLAEVVHRGVVYDLEVDTTHTESLDCARAIAAHVK